MLYVSIIIIVLVLAFFFAYRAARKLSIEANANASKEGVLLSIQLPRENEKLPIAAEQMFASLHGLIRFTPQIKEHLSLEIASSTEGIRFYVYTPKIF